jgi:hypothetical protein
LIAEETSFELASSGPTESGEAPVFSEIAVPSVPPAVTEPVYMWIYAMIEALLVLYVGSVSITSFYVQVRRFLPSYFIVLALPSPNLSSSPT